MKYLKTQNREFRIKKDINSYTDSQFFDEIKDIRSESIVSIDPAIINMFFTPLILLLLTFIPVAITSVLVIALGVIMDTKIFFVFLGIAYLLWSSLLVIVLIERKNKKKYFEDPVIFPAIITNKEYSRKNGFLLEFDLYTNEGIEKERLFLKTNISSNKTKEIKAEFCEKVISEEYIFVMVYKDQKRRCFPVSLIKK